MDDLFSSSLRAENRNADLATVSAGPALVIDLIRTRRSVRRYLPRPVPVDLLLQLLEAARWAPTGMNAQPWEFVLVTEEAKRRAIARHARFYFVRSLHVSAAPALIAICGHPRRSPMFQDDGCFAGATIMLAATGLGLGSCWIGAFDEPKVKEILSIPANLRIVGLITIGYPSGETATPPKRPLSDLVHYESYLGPGFAQHLTALRRSGPLSVFWQLLRAQWRIR